MNHIFAFQIQIFMISKSDKSVRSGRCKMLFLVIITIQTLQVMVISSDQPLPKAVYLNKYSIPTKSDCGSSPVRSTRIGRNAYHEKTQLPHLFDVEKIFYLLLFSTAILSRQF